MGAGSPRRVNSSETAKTTAPRADTLGDAWALCLAPPLCTAHTHVGAWQSVRA